MFHSESGIIIIYNNLSDFVSSRNFRTISVSDWICRNLKKTRIKMVIITVLTSIHAINRASGCFLGSLFDFWFIK